jgi:hypothetical protein
MKRLFTNLAMSVIRFALWLDGWTDKPRPFGYKPNPDLPFWRYRPPCPGVPPSIESGNLAHACNKSIFNRPS